MNIFNKIMIVAICFIGSTPTQAQDWTDLVDTNLSQWDIYLSYKIPDDYDGKQPTDSNGKTIEPLGYKGLEDQNIFSVLKEDDDIHIRVTGEYYGMLMTKEKYRNYHLRLKVKWGDKKWIPRLNKLKDTGILYHSIGDAGAEYYRSWKLSQEFQIMEGHMGDYWSQASSQISVKGYQREYVKSPVADERGRWLDIGNKSEEGIYAMRSANFESPAGEWTELELITYEGQSLHIVNGKVVMILKDSRYIDENGDEKPLREGQIQLQSEATEAFFKDIAIREIKSMPAQYKALFE